MSVNLQRNKSIGKPIKKQVLSTKERTMKQVQKNKSSEFDKIWKLFMENREQMKETDRRMQETKLLVQENARSLKETERLLKESGQETDRHMKETDRRMKETDLHMQETDRRMKETDRRLKELHYLFTGHWGKLMEALTTGGLKRALEERNIQVTGVFSNAEKTYNQQKREFDIVAASGEELVVVEVKTTLKLQQVRLFVENLKSFKNYFPEYKDKKVYGAMAYLKANEGAGNYAEKQGLFILNPVGNIIKVMNSVHFSPQQMA